jgi:hypothetical protein
MAFHDDARTIDAGIAAAPLIADPKSWINRRVETIELLSREETRRRVSVDFTLADDQLASLRSPDGVVVPISVLLKERLRAFDLRDEAGIAIPVLTREQGGALSLIALLGAASDALGPDVPEDARERLAADLRRIVFEPAETAASVRADFTSKAAVASSCHAIVDADPVCRKLLDALWTSFVLFAVLAEGGPNRRILKYAYSDVNVPSVDAADRRPSLALGDVAQRLWHPDREWFRVECPGAWRACRFHAEIVIPEELRFEYAVLYDQPSKQRVSAEEHDVNRAALYADGDIGPERQVSAMLEIAPERTGKLAQASTTSLLVTALLWLGVASGLDDQSPDAAVAILLGGAALFSGVTAVAGEHRLVSTIFSATRRWLLGVTFAALLASASLALTIPDAQPVMVWTLAAAGCSVAALRLAWSWIRGRHYTRTVRLFSRTEEAR